MVGQCHGQLPDSEHMKSHLDTKTGLYVSFVIWVVSLSLRGAVVSMFLTAQGSLPEKQHRLGFLVPWNLLKELIILYPQMHFPRAVLCPVPQSHTVEHRSSNDQSLEGQP